MPCSQRFAAALQETETTPDGVKMYTWRAVRRQQLRKLRKHTRYLVFFMGMIALIRSDPPDLVYQGRHGTRAPGSEDYGISYNVACIFAWLFMCVFAIFYLPFNSWWRNPSDSDDANAEPTPTAAEPIENSFIQKAAFLIRQFNMLALHSCVGIHLAQHIYHVVNTFKHVGPRPYDPKSPQQAALNTRKAWGIRALLLSGVCTSIAMGKIFFMIMEETDLARVKPLEYFVIVLPIQVNIGILMATVVQFKAEKRQARKMALRKVDAEVATESEKEGLLLEN